MRAFLIGVIVLAIWAPAAAAGTCHITQKRSISGSVKTSIKFVNKTHGAVQLYWLDYTGHLVYYGTLAAGASATQVTFKTAAWLMLNGNYSCVGYVVTPKPTYVITP